MSKSKIPLSLSIPQPKRKASFANLARFFGLGVGLSDAEIEKHHDSAEEDEQDDQEGGENDGHDNDVDEESLMWDAQAALIAHQPSLAMSRYTTAALPPYKSPAACLALGNLLTRGTGFTSCSPDQSNHDSHPSRKGKERAIPSPIDSDSPSPLTSPISSPPAFSRFLNTFFGPSPHSPPETPPMTTSSPAERKYDLVGNGWSMRKEGKRAVRDVEGMGVAGGWLVLGLGWIVDEQSNRSHRQTAFKDAIQIPEPIIETRLEEETFEDDAIVMSISKAKFKGAPHRSSLENMRRDAGGEGSATTSATASHHPSTTDLSSATNSSSTQTGETEDSLVLETPGSDVSIPIQDLAAETEMLRLIYNLLQPLLHLYRHGHIQANDPVFLPPVNSSQLPSVLRPVGDLQKGRNAWALGSVVVAKLLQIEALQTSIGLEHAASKERSVRDWRQLACGVRNIANYILGMTAEKHLRGGYFRSIIDVGPCGLTLADETVRQAAKRLDIINTPSQPPTPILTQDGYPFPQMTMLKPPARSGAKSRRNKGQAAHRSNLSNGSIPPISPSVPRRVASGASLRSVLAKSGASLSPVKTRNVTIVPGDSPTKRSSALDSLRQVSAPTTKHRRKGSNASILSLLSPSPEHAFKSLPSDAITSTSNVQAPGEQSLLPRKGSATDTLKRVRESSSDLADVDETAKRENVQWPNLKGWKMAVSPPPSEFGSPETPPAPPALLSVASPETHSREKERKPDTLKHMYSSPNLPSNRNTLSPPNKQHRSVASASFTPPRSQASSASLLGGDVEIAQIDPSLAAAELASALTKHVCCSVCAVKGVNFPECRKCGMRFCSRDCRVGEQGAGDGKRHLCGIWKTRLNKAKEAGLKCDGSSLPGIAVSYAESLGKTPTMSSVRAC